MEYKRLTERRGGLVIDKCGNCENVYNLMGCTEHCCYEVMKNRLSELEDKIENGTLIELPCKVGDTVYCVYAVSGIQEWEVMSIAIYDHGTVLRLGHKGTNDYNAAWLKEKGTYLFFTPEEAEKRLEELQE